MSKRNKLKTLYRAKAYVNLGHGSWLGFLLSIGTFTMVFYQYGVTYIPFFKTLFADNPLWFLFIAIPSYIFLAGCVGFWAYKSEGAEPTSAELAWSRNPAYQRIISLLEELSDKYEICVEDLENIKLEMAILSIEIDRWSRGIE